MPSRTGIIVAHWSQETVHATFHSPYGNADNQQPAALRRMSADQQLSLGTRQVVYL